MQNEKKNKKKKSIEEMTAREVGKKFLDELKAQGPKKGTKGKTYITRAGGSGAKKIMGKTAIKCLPNPMWSFRI